MGERIEVVRFWQNKVTRGAAMAVLSAALLGCTGSDVAETVDTPPKTKTVQTKTETSPEFTTVGKSTKTIETPWGSKHIYDMSKDPQVLDFYENWLLMHRKAKLRGELLYWDDALKQQWHIFNLAKSASRADLFRLGCREVISSTCGRYRYKIGPACDDENVLGSAIPSQCEIENHFTAKIEGRAPSICMRNGKQHESTATPINMLELRKRSAAYNASVSPDFVCNIWRGQGGSDEWDWVRFEILGVK